VLHPAAGSTAAAAAASEGGQVSLRQQGDRITGALQVTGLTPDSRHAWSIQGPAGGCAPSQQPANIALLFRDLVADGRGAASMRIDVIVHEPVLAHGYDVAVYRGPMPPQTMITALPSNPLLLCGDIPLGSHEK